MSLRYARTLAVVLALWPMAARAQEVQEVDDSGMSEGEGEGAGEEPEGPENHVILGIGVDQVNDWREGEWGHGAGPFGTLELVLFPIAIELDAGLAFTREDPVMLLDVGVKLLLENESRIDPFIGIGPTITMDIEQGGHVAFAAGGVLTAGAHAWLCGDMGMMADASYKVLGGQTLIHQVSLNLAFVGRLEL